MHIPIRGPAVFSLLVCSLLAHLFFSLSPPPPLLPSLACLLSPSCLGPSWSLLAGDGVARAVSVSFSTFAETGAAPDTERRGGIDAARVRPVLLFQRALPFIAPPPAEGRHQCVIMTSIYAADAVSQHATSSAHAWPTPSPDEHHPDPPPPSTATVRLRKRSIEGAEGYIFLGKSDVYHYADCPEAGNARYSGRSWSPPPYRRLSHCCIGWGMPEGFYYASDVMNLLTADIRARTAAGQDRTAGASGLQDAATAAAESVARSCRPRLPPMTGYADAFDVGVYHTLRVCPLLTRQPSAAEESVATDGRRVCIKCVGMEAVGHRLAPVDGPVTAHVVYMARQRPAYVSGNAYWVSGARTVHGHPLCSGLDTTTKQVLSSWGTPPEDTRPCRVCGGPGSDLAGRF